MTYIENRLLTIYRNLKNIILRYFSNRYLTTIVLCFVWMLFFDNNSIIRQLQRSYQIVQLNKEIKYYQRELLLTKKEEKALKQSDEYFEKFVREQYLLKKPNEVLYIFTEEN